ncbi:unnamed protein product [Larinioides sclopetarius]|uniref:Alpha/beta hydrolase n=1 Tax=Larinioides sclopetarius TaxID=280406 RepID=A0AAV2AC44_9ARAC
MHLKYDVYTPHYLNDTLAPVILLHSMIENRKTWLHIAPEIRKLTGRKPHTVEKLIIEDSTPKDFVFGGGKTVTLAVNMVKELNNMVSEFKDKEKAMDIARNMCVQFAAILRATKEQIMNYNSDLLPLGWTGDSLSFLLNTDAVANAVINNKLKQNISGTFEGDVLLLYGSKSQFKIGSDDEFLKYFPKTTKIEFENVGHFIHHLSPKKFIEEVTKFINIGPMWPAKY